MKKRKRVLNKFLFAWQVLKKFNADNGFLLSSALSFNILVGIIPLFLLLLSFAGSYLYSDQEVLTHIRFYLNSVLPSLDPKIMKVILRVIQDRKMVGILGIGGLLSTSIWVFTSLRTSLDIIFQARRGQWIIRGIVVDLIMVILIGSLHLASMTLTSVMVYLKRYPVGFISAQDMGIMVEFFLKYILPFFFSFCMFFLIYKIIPNKMIRFKTAFQVTLFITLLWESAKHFFGWYVLHLRGFTVVYGSLSTLVIFVLWIYYSAAILLLGGEVASLLENRRNS